MGCQWCGERLPVGGRGIVPKFCSTRCRVAAHRKRQTLPKELRAAARWARHWRKRPVTASGEQASSTDPATWTSYAAAARSKVGDGLGFMLGDGFACLDIDHCLWDDGTPDGRAREILDQVGDAYVEISLSGDGLHVWGWAAERKGRRTPGYEVYSRERFMTVTGRVFQPGRLVDLSRFF